MPSNFTMIEVFGIAFSIMGLLPSIASTLAYSIPAGPVGMVWGWFLASMFIFFVGLAMADLGSAMPTSGGLYWWVALILSLSKCLYSHLQVDALLLVTIYTQCSLILGRLQQHAWTCWRALLD